VDIRSLQIQTDVMLRTFEGERTDRQTYVVVRTPTNPTFRWGNFLVFPTAPSTEDLTRWPQIFADEMSGTAGVNHVAVTWDALDGDLGASDAFVAAGYDRWTLATMSLRKLAPEQRPPTPCEIRDLQTDADWTEWIELAEAQNAVQPLHYREGPGHRGFVEKTCAGHRAMIAAGWGRWFGAFVDGRLASSMGLFVRDGLGRFQAVDTHPDFRRRGLATTLLRHVVSEGLVYMGARTLVIVADVDEAAIGIYAAAGFEITERIIQIERVDRSL
jgi:ribosomal protein S18 acetylase RimI-like enzyme